MNFISERRTYYRAASTVRGCRRLSQWRGLDQEISSKPLSKGPEARTGQWRYVSSWDTSFFRATLSLRRKDYLEIAVRGGPGQTPPGGQHGVGLPSATTMGRGSLADFIEATANMLRRANVAAAICVFISGSHFRPAGAGSQYETNRVQI